MRSSLQRVPRSAIVLGVLLVAAGQSGPLGGGTEAARPAAATYRAWQVEPYGPVEWKEKDGVIDLESTTSPGGLFFRQAPASARGARLTIDGHAAAGQTTIRLTVDGGPPQWFPAPEGRTTLTTPASAAIEVVVYGDTPYAYRLGNLQLEPCADCQPAAAVLTTTFAGWIGLSRAVCEVRNAGQDQRYVCNKLPYDSRVALAAWQAPLAAAGIPTDTDLILRLMRHHVLSVSATDDRSRRGFLEMLARHGNPAP